MKANPVYKCTRCGEIIIKRAIELESDELSCVENISTHICDTLALLNADNGKTIFGDEVGIIKLVGYNEVLNV